MQAVGFESTEVVLDLPFPDPKTEDGWKIQLLTSPKVYCQVNANNNYTNLSLATETLVYQSCSSAVSAK